MTHKRKKTRPAVLVGFKSILFGRLEETEGNIAIGQVAVRFRLVMPDISSVN